MNNPIEIWKNDVSNMILFDRNYKTFDSRINIRPTLRNIDTESNLFLDSFKQHPQSNQPQQTPQSKQHLYRLYHGQEVNSVCYPNIDSNAFNNTTKALYTTKDTRDHFDQYEL